MPEPVEGTSTYLAGLDGIRAIAVLGVIAFHVGAGWAAGGLLGVGVFFVLSGYLITDLLVAEYRRRKDRPPPVLVPTSEAAAACAFSDVVCGHRLGDAVRSSPARRLEATCRRRSRTTATGGSFISTCPTSLASAHPLRSVISGRLRSRSSSTWSGRCCYSPGTSGSAARLDS